MFGTPFNSSRQSSKVQSRCACYKTTSPPLTKKLPGTKRTLMTEPIALHYSKAMARFWSQDLVQGWQLKCSDDANDQSWMPVAKVPTVVHLDLMDNNKIPDTNVDRNEYEAKWADEKHWTYRSEFTTPSNLQPSTRVALVFEGLDTFATVRLNETIILKSDNMFLSHRVDVTKLIRPDGPNVLAIDFEPAMAKVQEIADAHPEHKFLATLGGGNRCAARKAQYHWGWDWGPALASSGPWRPVRLETYSSRIEDANALYKLDDTFKSCVIDFTAQVDGSKGDKVQFALRSPEGETVFEAVCETDEQGSVSTQFALSEPSLWYPLGHGKQNLYQLDVELLVLDSPVHQITKRVGFRRAELVQQPDKFGKSFFFRVNNVDIFAGGNCWIPGDSFLPRLSAKDYKDWVQLMADGNQIMTRVWGGGIYEEDVFYDTCDELGILVWQDFMFACGSYPGYKEFLDSVEAEARSNVRRLRHHPSVIVYAGGNENYYIQELNKLEYNYEGDKDPQSWLKSSFPSRYIYEHLLPKVIAEESPHTDFHPDSPWGDGKNILDDTVGDIHQWEIWHGIMRPYQDYYLVDGRFNSEFGMQSYPHMETVSKFVTNPREKHPQSFTVDSHNKCKTHERRLATYVRENFRATDASLKNWVYLTQLLQSEAMHYAYRCWRREWGSAGARRCGGALVWQMNDCWPGISWAVVDYFKVKKPAFYAMKRDLNPLAVGVVRTYDVWTKGQYVISDYLTYDVWVASDEGKAASILNAAEKPKVEVDLRFVNIHTGQDALESQRHDISETVKPNQTNIVCDAVQIPNPQGHEAFIVAATLIVNGQVISRDVDWPQPFKFISFEQDRGLKVDVDSSRTAIEISCDRPIKGLVFAERVGLEFSDNGFDVVPGEKYTVQVQGLAANEELQWTFLGMDESNI